MTNTVPAVLLLFALAHASQLPAVARAQAPATVTLPTPREVEEALTALRRSRNPTFVEYQHGPAGRVLVVGVPYSYQGLNDDLTQDFENIYEVLAIKNWIPHFVELQLMVPQPLMKVRTSVDDVRRLHASEMTKTEFRLKWRTDKLGP